ncbi:MAG: hypothetical protein LBG20_01785 [Holosporaceae bacterium]|nr:hypothetical protein [Holosporaceae bacterium]
MWKTAYAYLVLDPERRGREISKIVSEMKGNTSNKSDGKDVDLSNCGKFVLLSSKKIDPNNVIPLYYIRQIAERMFGIAKDDLNILPLRTHSEPNFKGFMMLTFISLIVYCSPKNRLGNVISIEKALSIMRSLNAKSMMMLVLLMKLTKKQRILLETLNIIVPKIRGA